MRLLAAQLHRSQPVGELDHDVLLTFVDPARHPVARDSGDLDRADTLAGRLVDAEEVRGAV